MRDGYRIVDADRHVMEPVDLWARYLPEDLRPRAPYLAPAPAIEGTPEERLARYGHKALLPLPPSLMLDGRPVWSDMTVRAQLELSWSSYERREDVASVFRPEGQVASLNRSGIDAAFLYPTLALYVVGYEPLEPGLGAAYARAYNDWLKDYTSHDPARLRGVGVISTSDPASMAQEAERVAGFGWKAVTILPNVVGGRGLSDPAYDPFWAVCERLSLGVAIHAGTHTRVPCAGADRFRSHFSLHACAHPMEHMMAFLSLVEGGVLERHPALRVAFLESGAGWVPYWLYRLDEIEYAHYAAEVAETVKRKPSEYFTRQCFVAIEPDEPYLASVVAHVGAGSLLFGTDFPHGDHGDEMVDDALSLARSMPREAVEKILWHNPARFYALEP